MATEASPQCVLPLTEDGGLYVRTHKGVVRVQAIFSSVDDANEAMAQFPMLGVVRTYGPFVLLASMLDDGMPVDKL
jgi:hypothetical protein